MGLVKQPLRRQFFLDLLERQREIPCPLGGHRLHIELINAARLIDANPAARNDLHTILRLKTKALLLP